MTCSVRPATILVGVPTGASRLEFRAALVCTAHPNIRVFVTHGGLLSTQESVYHGVPVVGMPMFGDQQFNMRIAVTKGFGVTVDFMTLTKEALVEALNEVIGDPK